jgi:hypothetical protein
MLLFSEIVAPGSLVFLLCRPRSLCRVICNSRFIRYEGSVVYVHCGGIRCTMKLFSYLTYTTVYL